MRSVANLFNTCFLDNQLSVFSIEEIHDFERKWKLVQNWKRSCENSNLQSTKESSVHGKFLSQIFGDVLGYSSFVDSLEYNLVQELSSEFDNTGADGGLGFYTNTTIDTRVVIELKDANTPLDRKQNRQGSQTPVEQAFSYSYKNGRKCGWVIVSNFIETRLYKSGNALAYEVFDIRKIDKKSEFKKLYFMLCKDHLICKDKESLIDNLYEKNERIGKEISEDFYKNYKIIRKNLYSSLIAHNSKVDELLLFTKSQKLLDRFVFICFCEGCGLLPENIFLDVIKTAKNSFDEKENMIWSELKGLFNAINEGMPRKNINRYNGGLFKADPDLDDLLIKDDILESFKDLSGYDFKSDLNVNILGHIFEQSISDVEQIKKEIQGLKEDNTKRKQKEDGIFYTPEYVTKYIVEKTVGRWLDAQKENVKKDIIKSKFNVVKPSTGNINGYKLSCWEEEIPDEIPRITLVKNITVEDDEYDMHREAVLKSHIEYWNRYEKSLKSIKILDPAVGSGAFLNQCLDFLHREMEFCLQSRYLLNSQYSIFDIDKNILKNNLFGVDINEESVEITKLSLWLKTAKMESTLASLDDNIKCGNSIIGDSKIAGDLAFDWTKEFPEVMKNGGFDIIIGNPPYGASLSEDEKKYIEEKYSTTEGNHDTYKTFFELGYLLLKDNGYLGYITPNTYFTLERSAEKLRKLFFDNTALLDIVEVFNVFPEVIVDPIISIFKKGITKSKLIDIILVPRNVVPSSTFISEGVHKSIDRLELKSDKSYIFNYKISSHEKEIYEKIISETVPLQEKYYVFNGAKPYEKGKGCPPQTKETLKEKPFNGYSKIDEQWLPYMRGKSIKRYTNAWDGEYIKYGKWLAAPRNRDIFFREKVFVRQTGDSLIATLDNGNVSNDTLHVVYPLANEELSNKYILGILNSSLMNWIYQIEHPTEIKKPMAQVKGVFIKKLPLKIADKENQKIVEILVEELLYLNKSKQDSAFKFYQYIMEIYEPKKLTGKIKEFYDITFKEFISELKNQKVKLTDTQQIGIMSLFQEEKGGIIELTNEIHRVEEELNKVIYKIYDIDSKDIY